MVLVKIVTTVLMSLIMWALVNLSVDIFANSRGTIDPFGPFVSTDFETTIGAFAIVSLGIGIGCITRVLYWHHRAWVGAVALLILAGFFASSEFLTGQAVNLLAVFGDFQSTMDIPGSGEMILRGKFFAMLSALVLIGMVPGVYLGRVVETGTARKFRKIRKRLQRRSANAN